MIHFICSIKDKGNRNYYASIFLLGAPKQPLVSSLLSESNSAYLVLL
jgi:hypothetical protein